MKLVSLFLVLITLCFCGSAIAQPFSYAFGVSPIFANLSSSVSLKKGDVSLNDDLGINKNNTMWEGHFTATAYRCMLSGYYLFPVNRSSDGLIPAALRDGKETKPLVVSTDYSFQGGHLELGYPWIRYKGILIEPFLVYQNAQSSVTITGKKYSHEHSTKYNDFGLGVYAQDQIARSVIVDCKFFITQHSSQSDINVFWANKYLFIGSGYTLRTFSGENMNLRLSGPVLIVELVF